MERNADVSPLRMEVKFKNNLILRKMEEKGITTVAELCRQANLRQTQVGKLVNMTELPITDDGNWRLTVFKLADFFGCLPEDIFSEEQREMKLATNCAKAELTFGEVQAVLAANHAESQSPERAFEHLELAELVGKILNTLTPTQAKVLRLRFGLDGGVDYTLDETAEVLGMQRNQVRAVEAHAIRRLRYPTHANYLAQFFDAKRIMEENSEIIHGRTDSLKST